MKDEGETLFYKRFDMAMKKYKKSLRDRVRERLWSKQHKKGEKLEWDAETIRKMNEIKKPLQIK